MKTYITEDTQAKAENLLWRWEAHRAGEKAFEKSFPAIRCDEPLWRAMDIVVRDHNVRGTLPPAGGFNFMTFTERADEVAGHPPIEVSVSPAAMKMLKYAASGYAAPDIPKATRDAMDAWITERQRLLREFAGLFKDDGSWHPYQCCIRAAESSLWNLTRALNDAAKGEADS